MWKEQQDLSERLVKFGACIIKFIPIMKKTAEGRHIALQLTRSGTSAGANYEEACGAQSKADFIHKMQLVLKELRESKYWLRLIRASGLVPENNTDLQALIIESGELGNIIGKSIVTVKGK